MNCPVCDHEMVERDFGGVKVDVCEGGCKGIWFDWFELSKLDELNEGMGQALEAALNFPRTNTEERPRINCPKCGIPMHIHKYQSSKLVNVDECYKCAGFFLDSGELSVMRDSHMTEAEEQEYLDKLLEKNETFQQALLDQAQERERVAALSKFTRFFRLSYYMTGK